MNLGLARRLSERELALSHISVSVTVAAFMAVPIYQLLAGAAQALLLLGGAAYIVGGLCYANGWPRLSRDIGPHDVMHVCVLVGSAFHWWMVYRHI